MMGTFDKLLALLAGSIPIPSAPSDQSFVPTTDEEWSELIREAHRQRVMGLLADAVVSLPENHKPSREIRKRLIMEVVTIEGMNMSVNAAAYALMNIFTSAGLHPVIQKGPSVAALYPNPLHRESGDIDICFIGDEFKRSREVALTLCDKVTDESDGAFHYNYAGVLVEHHPRFYDSSCQFSGIDIHSPEAQIIMLSMHILKHSLGKGIGLKQICDYFVATEKLAYDRSVVSKALAGIGLTGWQNLLDKFGPELSRIVERSGNFGRGDSDTRKSRFSTAWSFLRSLPFALKYAPREWIHTVTELAFR